MPALSKKLMRTLPTLTEVVDLPPVSLSAPKLAPGPAGDVEEMLTQRVLQRLEQTLDARVQKVVAEALQEQMKELAPRIRQRVDNAVRKALAQAAGADSKPPAGRKD